MNARTRPPYGGRLLLAVTGAILLVVVARVGLALSSYVNRAGLPMPAAAQPAPCLDLASLAARHEPRAPSARGTVVAHLLEYECDTRGYLADLFETVTGEADDDLEAGLLWVSYLQRTLASTGRAPLDAAGTPIYHPLWLLEHGEMDCSQVSRLVVDGFNAVGIPARLLQLKGHVSAEFFAGGRWRLAEADVLGDGEFVRDARGDPASLDDILRDPSLLDGVRPYVELTSDTPSRRSAFADVFEQTVYPQAPLSTPYVIRKVDRPAPRLRLLFWLNESVARETERGAAHYYGWHQYVFCERSEPACTN